MKKYVTLEFLANLMEAVKTHRTDGANADAEATIARRATERNIFNFYFDKTLGLLL